MKSFQTNSTIMSNIFVPILVLIETVCSGRTALNSDSITYDEAQTDLGE